MLRASGTANFAHQTIWTGDNLDIMRGMNSASVDLIYLDPPFNSNANYAAPIGSQAAGAAFKDTWGLDDINLAWHGEIKHDYPGLYALLSATRQIHGDSMMSYLIYMAIRLMEMKRLLKSTGSIYLHCDPTAGHYLKLLMDAVFGVQFYKNDVVWKRTARGYKGSQHKPRRFNTNTDSILFYGGRNAYFDMDSVLEPYDPEVYGKTFRFHDEKGPYYFDVAYNRPSASPRPNLCYEYKGFWPPHESGWKVGQARMEELDEQGDIVVRNGKLQRKVRPGGGEDSKQFVG